jgi:hypothetical protein
LCTADADDEAAIKLSAALDESILDCSFVALWDLIETREDNNAAKILMLVSIITAASAITTRRPMLEGAARN